MPCRYVAQACRAATLKQGAVTSAATRRNSSRSMPDASAVSASILLLARLKNLRNEGRPNEGWPCQTVLCCYDGSVKPKVRSSFARVTCSK